MDVLNTGQKRFLKQYIEKYDIKREGDGFWKLVEIQMALKNEKADEYLELLIKEDFSSEQLEQGRIAMDDGIPIDVIRTFYKKENTAEEMRKARWEYVFGKEEQVISVMEMSDDEYLQKYLPAEKEEEDKAQINKLKSLEKVVEVLEKRLEQFKGNVEENSNRMEMYYKEELKKKERMVEQLRMQIKSYEEEKEEWRCKEIEYKEKIVADTKENQKYKTDKETNLNIKEDKTVKEKLLLFFDASRERKNKKVLEYIIVKKELSAEQLQVVNEAISNNLSIEEIRKIANKKYSVDKMRQLIRFYQNQKQPSKEKKDNVTEKEVIVNDCEDKSQYNKGLEQKYESYEEQYDSYSEDYGESYSEDYQEEYEEDDE